MGLDMLESAHTVQVKGKGIELVWALVRQERRWLPTHLLAGVQCTQFLVSTRRQDAVESAGPWRKASTREATLRMSISLLLGLRRLAMGGIVAMDWIPQRGCRIMTLGRKGIEVKTQESKE